jgi:predicted small integral membrane protein
MKTVIRQDASTGYQCILLITRCFYNPRPVAGAPPGSVVVGVGVVVVDTVGAVVGLIVGVAVCANATVPAANAENANTPAEIANFFTIMFTSFLVSLQVPKALKESHSH